MFRDSGKQKAYIALACVCFFWGTTYLALRIGIDYIPPFLLSGIRQAIAGLLIILYFIFKGNKLPSLNDFLIQILCGIMMIALGNGLVAWAELYVSSGLAALLCSLVPIWIIIINYVSHANEKLNIEIVAGIVLGFAGVSLIFMDSLKDFSNEDYSFGIIAILVANLSWAIGTVVNKRNKSGIDPILAAGIQVFSGGIFLLLTSLFLEDYSKVSFAWQGVLSLIYLILFGSIVAYGSYIYALSKLPTTIVSVYAYINPLVAIVLGWLILNERMDLMVGLSAIVTLTGIFLVNKGVFKNK
jgi:drug/metabolite transporter (DMT)-like permease